MGKDSVFNKCIGETIARCKKTKTKTKTKTKKPKNTQRKSTCILYHIQK